MTQIECPSLNAIRGKGFKLKTGCRKPVQTAYQNSCLVQKEIMP